MENYDNKQFEEDLKEFLQDSIKFGYKVEYITSHGVDLNNVFKVHYSVSSPSNIHLNASCILDKNQVNYYRLKKRNEKVNKIKNRINGNN